MGETRGAAVPQPVALVRGLGLLDATLLIVGSVIGSGIFFAPSIMAGYLQSPGLLLGLWVVGGLLTLAGALSYAELAAAMPRAGGPVRLPLRGVLAALRLPLRLDAAPRDQHRLRGRGVGGLCQDAGLLRPRRGRGARAVHGASPRPRPGEGQLRAGGGDRGHRRPHLDQRDGPPDGCGGPEPLHPRQARGDRRARGSGGRDRTRLGRELPPPREPGPRPGRGCGSGSSPPSRAR